MLLILLLGSFALAQTATIDDDLPVFELPDIYYVEIERLFVKSGLVTDIQVWVTQNASVVKYDGGSVQYVKTANTSEGLPAGRYEIHSITTVNQDVEQICDEVISDSEPDELVSDQVMPSTVSFEKVGEEYVRGEQCVKFVKKYIGSRSTWWAIYSKEMNAWVPVRYEEVDYDIRSGGYTRYDIFDFNDFKTTFDEDYSTLDKFGDLCYLLLLNQDMHDKTSAKHSKFMDKGEHVHHEFRKFKHKFNKKYSRREHAIRREIFQRNLRLVRSTNRKTLGYKLAVNRFSDYTPEEVKKSMGLLKRKEGSVGTVPFPYSEEELQNISSTLPPEYDLRELGLVSSIKNQESCGSCWTYGTTGAVEGALARVNGGKLMSLSNQALIDCAWEFGAYGCDGGSDTDAYKWMMAYGLPTEEEYGPYTEQNGYCNILNMTKTFPIRGFIDVTSNSVGALKVAIINHGPVSVSLSATDSFMQYSSGIFYDSTCNPTDLNHEVTLVGYGEKDGDAYWILKNSWGPDWGIDGYMHMAVSNSDCGVMVEPTYVVF